MPMDADYDSISQGTFVLDLSFARVVSEHDSQLRINNNITVESESLENTIHWF